jgi:squalene synthase HpnC
LAQEFLHPRAFVRSPAELERVYSPAEALLYTRWLATSHYENFHVVSFLLPKRLHQDFYNVYSFCRWSDDLGDEIGDRQESLRLLDWWRGELVKMSRNEVRHPVFVALYETVKRHGLPLDLFLDLIHAFEQDQTVSTYATYTDLYDYCHYSANPVGRLVLMLCGYSDERRFQLSDATCTALQLANFWQDVTVDLEKDRIYIPLEVIKRHGYTVEELRDLRFTPPFREVMKEICQAARALFLEGLPLVDLVNRRLALDLDLFSRGGLKVLDKIEALDYNVLAQRPAISRAERVRLLLGSLGRVALGSVALRKAS